MGFSYAGLISHSSRLCCDSVGEAAVTSSSSKKLAAIGICFLYSSWLCVWARLVTCCPPCTAAQPAAGESQVPSWLRAGCKHRSSSGASWACASGKSSHSPTKDVHWGCHLTSHWCVIWRKVPLIGRLPLKDLYGHSLPLVANACCSEWMVFLLHQCLLFTKRNILFLLLSVNWKKSMFGGITMEASVKRVGREEQIFSLGSFPSWCCPKAFLGI